MWKCWGNLIRKVTIDTNLTNGSGAERVEISNMKYSSSAVTQLFLLMNSFSPDILGEGRFHTERTSVNSLSTAKAHFILVFKPPFILHSVETDKLGRGQNSSLTRISYRGVLTVYFIRLPKKMKLMKLI